MENSLLAKLRSLSEKERGLFYRRLTNILNDRYSCFVYGGMNNKDYATMPKSKLEILEVNLYNHLFNNLEPPVRRIIESFYKNKPEKLDPKLADLSDLKLCNFIKTKKKSVYSLKAQN